VQNPFRGVVCLCYVAESWMCYGKVGLVEKAAGVDDRGASCPVEGCLPVKTRVEAWFSSSGAGRIWRSGFGRSYPERPSLSRVLFGSVVGSDVVS
jgi:hypothetical protein